VGAVKVPLRVKDPLRCGSCGGSAFLLENERDESEGRADIGVIHVTCCQCRSVSLIQASEPRIQIEWGEGAEGVICGGWGKK
jgi:hypothetical protein